MLQIKVDPKNAPRGALARLADYGDDSSEENLSADSEMSSESDHAVISENVDCTRKATDNLEESLVKSEAASIFVGINGLTDEEIGGETRLVEKHEDIQTTMSTGDREVESLKDDTVIKETPEVGCEADEAKPILQIYRERKDSSASSTSSDDSSDVEFSSDTSSHSDNNDSGGENRGAKLIGKNQVRKKKPVPYVKGELFLEDLEPIVDLQISVPENKVEPIGKVGNIVGCLVTVASFEKKPALDINTVLFIDEGRKAMGHIFEVFGRTSQPYYCVRFNSPEHVKEKGIEPGTLVYAAPGTEHTRYVFLAQLERLRGTDASWKDDHEAPTEFVDFSDDETERFVKNGNRKPRIRKQMPLNRSFPPELNEPREMSDDMRLSRKRNFNQHSRFVNPSSGVKYGTSVPPGFPPPNGFAPGPFRPSFSPHFRCMVPDFPNPQDYYVAPRYGSVDPYGNHQFVPTAPNPFSIGGAAVTFRPPYSNAPNDWINYAGNQNSSYWQPPRELYPYDYQAAWAYQYQSNLQQFSVAQPPPPPPQPIVGAPVVKKDPVLNIVKPVKPST